jgi:hypothetical protein
MARAEIARATITKLPDGFSVAVFLKRGQQIDAWRLESLQSLSEAENAVRAFATQYNLPWEQVEIIAP